MASTDARYWRVMFSRLRSCPSDCQAPFAAHAEGARSDCPFGSDPRIVLDYERALWSLLSRSPRHPRRWLLAFMQTLMVASRQWRERFSEQQARCQPETGVDIGMRNAQESQMF